MNSVIERMPKVHPNVQHALSSAEYFAAPGLSHSASKRLRISPYHYHALLEPGAPAKEPTAAMRQGTLTHCAFLEPTEFIHRYVVGPDISKNSNTWKAFVLDAQQRELEVITQVEADRAWAQANALRAEPAVAELLAYPGVQTEVSVWWKCPRTGVLCKARIDLVAPIGDGSSVVLLDAKTTSDADEFKFARSCSDYGYHTQADWYSEGYALATGATVEKFIFGAVESEYPYATRAFVLSADSLRRARFNNDNVRALYRSCITSGEWPGYPHDSTGVTLINVPDWNDDRS